MHNAQNESRPILEGRTECNPQLGNKEDAIPKWNQIGAKENAKTTSGLNFKLHGQASRHRFSSIPIPSHTMMLYRVRHSHDHYIDSQAEVEHHSITGL